MIIRPQKNFVVVRQLANHTDTATYYVRAVIRDAFTDEILATLDLDNKGSQRFSKSWLVAQDPSGEGRDISIVTSVYTDSGYTTKSENYGDEENTHTIEDRRTANGGGGAMGGGKLDSATIRRIMAEELKKVKDEEKAQEAEEPEEVMEPEDTQVIDKLNSIETAIKAIVIPQAATPEKVNLDPVFEGMSTIYNAVLDKEVTPPTDLTEVKYTVESLKKANTDFANQVIQVVQGMEDKVQATIAQETKKVFSKMRFVIPFNTLSMADKEDMDGEKGRAKLDVDVDSLSQ
jgi:hypothetical protein